MLVLKSIETLTALLALSKIVFSPFLFADFRYQQYPASLRTDSVTGIDCYSP